MVGLSLVAVTLVFAVTVLVRPAPIQMTVTGLGSLVSFETKKGTVGEALAEAGITLDEKDLVTPTLDTELDRKQKALTVTVEKAKQVSIMAGGRVSQTVTQAATVGDLLQEQAISLGEDDRVEPGLATPVTTAMSVRVIRVTSREEVSRMEIPFETYHQSDRSMSIGEERELQSGEPGVRQLVTRIIEEDGQEIGQQILSDELVKEPVNQVVAYGTAGVVARGGQNFRYTQELSMTATGYTAGPESNPWGTGHTYTGILATRGVVAIDPSVIPLGTRVYVEGYGPALAADIGGAIKGMRIDLCFDTVDEALEWGVRTVTVYVLGD